MRTWFRAWSRGPERRGSRRGVRVRQRRRRGGYVVYGWTLMLLLLPVAASAEVDPKPEVELHWNDAGGCRDYDGTKLFVESYPDSPRAEEGVRVPAAVGRRGGRVGQGQGLHGHREGRGIRTETTPRVDSSSRQGACLNRLMAELAVERLLEECREHQRQHRLTTGSGGNALDCYRNVLDQDPGNQQALAGIESIETYYSARAYEAIESERPDAARSSIERLESINPGHPEVENLRARLKELMHALEERDRLEREREALRAEVESLLDRNRYEEALSRLEEGRKRGVERQEAGRSGENGRTRLPKPSVCWNEGEFAGARARLDEALRHGLDEADHGEWLRAGRAARGGGARGGIAGPAPAVRGARRGGASPGGAGMLPARCWPWNPGTRRRPRGSAFC